jgi:cytochrome P450
MSEQPLARREVRGYQAVREAAKDTETYSSDLIGDRDTRDYRQLPLELDPPRHGLFREAVQPIFMSDAIAPKSAQFEQLALDLMGTIATKGGGDIVSEFALPYVMGCLTIIYNRPQDFDEWVSWGPDVWTAEAYSKGLLTAEALRPGRERSAETSSVRSGATLEAYLKRVFDAATPATGADPATTDIWDWVSASRSTANRSRAPKCSASLTCFSRAAATPSSNSSRV